MVWASIGEQERVGLNVALNEATWLTANVDTSQRRARLLLDVLSVPADIAATHLRCPTVPSTRPGIRPNRATEWLVAR